MTDMEAGLVVALVVVAAAIGWVLGYAAAGAVLIVVGLSLEPE